MRHIVLFGLLVLLSGCGASAQQEIAAAIRTSDAAWARGDLEGVCSQMTSSARQHKSAGVDLRADVCDQVPAIGSAESNLGVVVQHLYVRGAEPVRLTRIRVDGDTAIATYSNGDRPQLRKINGRWLIDSF